MPGRLPGCAGPEAGSTPNSALRSLLQGCRRSGRRQRALPRRAHLGSRGRVKRVSVLPLQRIERSLIHCARRRHVEGITVLTCWGRQWKLRGSGRRIVGVRIGVRRRLLSPASLCPPILKTKRGCSENDRCDCQEKHSSHRCLLCMDSSGGEYTMDRAREKRLQDFGYLKNESGQDGIAADCGGILQTFHRLPGTIDIDPGFVRIDEPAEFCAIRNVLGHFVLKLGQCIARRHHLSNEVRTQMTELLEFVLTEGGEPVPSDPRSVRAADSAIRQSVTSGRSINDAGSVFSCPIGEVIAKDIPSLAAVQPFRSHND